VSTLTTVGDREVGSQGDRPLRSAPQVLDRRLRYRLTIGAAVLAGLALRVAIGLTDDAATTDETAYLQSGISWVEGEGFQRDGAPELHFPPFVPFLLGVASRVFPDPHTGSVWIRIVASTALVVPLALLADRIAGSRAGATTAWIAALAPGLSTLLAVRGAGSEATYALLVVTALWLVVSTADHSDPRRLMRAGGAGLLAGLAYLTRPEGLFIAAVLGLAVVAVGARGAHPWPSRLRSAGTVGAVFAIPLVACIVPYAMFLHTHTGSWQLTAKTQDASIEAWHEVAAGDREARDRVIYALDETGLRFTTDRSSLTSLARDDPSGYLGIVGTNVQTLFKATRKWTVLPPVLWVLAALAAWRHRRSRAVRLVVGVAAVPTMTALAFFVQDRYLVVPIALTIVLVGVWVASLSDRLRSIASVGIVGLVVVPSILAFHGPEGWGRPPEHSDARAVGEWLNAHTRPDDRVMTRSMVVEYYADRPGLAIPYAELDQIVRFGRYYGAQYLVADAYAVSRVRPQLEPLLEQDRWAGLRLVHEAHAEGRTARVFAFDPPPPRTDEPGPSLGFMGDS
jgi:hypothetical protein